MAKQCSPSMLTVITVENEDNIDLNESKLHFLTRKNIPFYTVSVWNQLTSFSYMDVYQSCFRLQLFLLK